MSKVMTLFILWIHPYGRLPCSERSFCGRMVSVTFPQKSNGFELENSHFWLL